ncbi:MAG: hypothetical protein ACTHNY_06145 [Solirubrobacterales bacterium]
MSHRLLAHAWTRAVAVLALSLAPLFAVCAYSQAAPIPATKLLYATGKIVPIPASIPHEEGDMVDKRILPDLRWIAKRYPIFVTDGYSGPLPNGEHAGCNRCHTRGSDHYNGLAVDLVPLNGDGKCDSTWTGITRLAAWAEPVQGEPRPPFRWVGYDGDAGHGCGNHLHLSWNHAIAPEYTLAQWVEVFSVSVKGSQPTGPTTKPPEPPPPPRPSGGVAQASFGGLSPRVD